MVTADWVLLAFSLLSIFIGWQKGALRILAGIGALFIAWQVARTFASYLSGWFYSLLGLTVSGDGEPGVWNSLYLFLDGISVFEKVFYVIAFIIIFVLVVIIIRAIAKAIKNAIHGNVVGSLDSAVGAFFGLLVFAIIINLFMTLFLPLVGNDGVFGQLNEFLASSQTILPLLLGMTGYFLTNTSGIIEFFGLPQFGDISANAILPPV